MNLYGRNLPTPTIEKMTLLDVKDDDEFIVGLEELAAADFEAGAYEAVLDQMNAQKAQIISTTTRIDIDISFYLQTWEGFDVNELTRELFEQITTSPSDLGTSDKSNSLYINAAVTYPSSPDAGDSVGVLRRKNKLDLLSIFYDHPNRDQFNQLDRMSPDSRPDANYLAAAISNMSAIWGGGRSGEYEVSVPLSDFYEVAQLTAEYDVDDNPIIKISNIKLTFYITAFSNHPNISFYAVVSTGVPAALAAGTALDPVSYSMNFSDLTYEDLVKNGSLSTIGDPVFVDSNGIYYPNMPLRAINKKYYKIDDYGPKQIIDQTNVFLSEYRAYLASDAELLDAVNQIKLLILTEQDSIQFLQFLNKSGQVYSETSKTTRFSRFYERFRILVNNADATLRNQQEVVKRVYRNYKVVDARAFVPPPLDAMSYVPELAESSDYLYEQIFHSNLANFVPMDTQPSEYPGRAELPLTPSERLDAFSQETEAIRNEVVTLLMPYTGNAVTVRGFDYGAGDADMAAGVYDTGIQRNIASKLPWEDKSGMSSTNNKLYETGYHAYSIDDVSYSASEINAMLGDEYNQGHPLDRAAMKLTWWIYHVWAGRFVQGSEHKAYKVDDDFDGVHWYMAGSEKKSGDAEDANIRSKRAEWPIINPHTSAKNEGSKTHPPKRWERMVKGLCQAESYVPPRERVKTVLYGGEEVPLAQQERPPSRPYENTDDDWTISKFGYSPNAHAGYYDAPAPHMDYVDARDLSIDANASYHKAYRHPAFWFSTTFSDLDKRYRRLEGGYAPRKGYYQYYLNSFFYTVTDDKNVWALNTLANLDEQLSFWVPKSSITPTGREITYSQAMDWNPSMEDSDYGMGIFATGWDPEEYYLYGSTGLAAMLGSDAGSVEDLWERIGGVRAISGARPRRPDGTPRMFINGLQPKNWARNRPESAVPYVRIKRRKLKRIYRDVRALIMNLFGMDEDGKGMDQARRATGTGGTVYDDMETASTNPFTTLDTYLQEMPGLIADEVSNKMFDNLRNLPYAELDSVIEIHSEAAAATEQLHADYIEALSVYLKKDVCSIYVATSYPGHDGHSLPDHSYGADNVRRLETPGCEAEEFASKLAWGQPGDQIAGGDGFTVVPYGKFSLPGECFVKGKSGRSNAVSNHRDKSEVFKLDFGSAIKQLMMDNFLDNKESIKQKAIQYLSSRRELDSFQSDVGIHSTLAEVDIVLNKYGFFFFDLEKYIRKRSLMSRVINVDRLLGYMSSGQDMTNAAIRFQSVRIQLNNFGTREEGAPYATPDARWGFHNRGPMPDAVSLKLTCDLDTSPYSPTNFDEMRFDTLFAGGDPEAPIVYNRIERINSVRFDQIAGFTTDPARREGGAGESMTADSSGGTTTTGADTTLSADDMEMSGPGTDQQQYTGAGRFPGSGQSNANAYMAGGDYSPFREADRDADRTDQVIGLLEGQEVDINAVLDEYQTANVITKISLRNYTFEGFSDMVLNLGASWQNNYRMMCFKYQFFMDDDLAYSNNAHEGFNPLDSVDDIKISIEVRDNSPELVKALCDKYFEEYEAFGVYVDAAQEACAFDAFDQAFNKFFSDAMLDEYTQPIEQPWFRMVATYITLYNLFSDVYAGDRSKMEEAANNILETIRPETGYLSALISFNDACEDLKDRLETASVDVAHAENDFIDTLWWFDISGDSPIEKHGPTAKFDIYRTLAAPVIDHIGDYTTREDKMNGEF
jgi:hypothetical protein